MDKNEIRAQILAKRDALSAEEIEDKSRQIFERLVNMEEYRNAENILVYASMGSEVRTDDIILDALANGKKVFCPKVTDKKIGLMEFVRITALEDLAEGYFGIREPEITEESEIAEIVLSKSDNECDEDGKAAADTGVTETSFYNGHINRLCLDQSVTLVIMPGVAFDTNGNRIGYGGGFYDRYLSKHGMLRTIALCFQVQISEESINNEDTDIKPDRILSEG